MVLTSDPASAATKAPPAVPTAPPRESALMRLYPALRNREFRLLWLGMLPATIAWQMSTVAAPYAAFTMSGAAAVLGLVSLSTGLPMLLLSLVGGVVADRLPRRMVLVFTQSVLGLGAVALAVLTMTGRLDVWHLLAIGLMQGTSFAFNMPARQAYIADLVGRPLLRNAVALNNAGMNFCRIAGPSLAGVLLSIAGVGIAGVFVLMAVMYGIVVATLLRLPDSRPAARRSDGGNSWDQLVEGLRYVTSSPVLVALMGVAFLTLVLGMPFQTLMPVFAERVYAVGAGGLGVLMGSVGVGALCGSVAVAALVNVPRPGLLQVGFGMGFGLSLVGFALAPTFLLAVVALLLVGFASSAYTALNNTLVMGNTEPRFYGRVMSVYMLTFATMPVGAVPLSWLTDQVGARMTLAVAGGTVVAAIAAVALFYPPYRRIE